MRYIVSLLALAVLVAPAAQRSAAQDKDKDPAVKEMEEKEPDTTPEDIKILKDVGVAAEGPALLDYFRKRTFKEADPKRLETLIAGLGSEDFPEREEAYAELMELGTSAIEAIKKAAEGDKNAEAKRRAADLRQRIEAKLEPNVQMATARMIARIKPEGAAQVMLNYLPFAADRGVIDEICKSLAAVTVTDGKVEPAVLKAVSDKVPLKRAAAGEALARAKVAEQMPAVRKLIKDPEPIVRLRVALALVPQRDGQVVPTLIESLKHLPPDDLWQAEEILVRLAGEEAPNVALGTTEATRETAHAAWAKWLEKNPKVDLAKLSEATSLLGYTLLVQQGNRFVGGRVPSGQVMEMDRDKNVKWKFDLTTYPVDAQIVKRDRVLIAEYQGGVVSERDFKGIAHWTVNVGGNPIGVQRLPNGNTFVVMQQMLAEYDAKGKQKFVYQRFNDTIFRAKKLRSGEILMISGNGVLTRYDPKTQKDVKSFFVGHPNNLFGGFDVLPSGNIVVAQQNNNQVVEFDQGGKEKNRWQVQQPNSVMALPNGHLLVNSNNSRRIVELDRTGREVWSHNITDGTPFNARRR